MHAGRHSARRRELWERELEAKQADAAVRPRQCGKAPGKLSDSRCVSSVAGPRPAGSLSSPEDRRVCEALGLAYADGAMFFVEGGKVHRRSPPRQASASPRKASASPHRARAGSFSMPRPASATRLDAARKPEPSTPRTTQPVWR